ncbi:MAG TPA: PAS domain-containing sensor histidine kinase [Ktedonobacteraceae bacterium]|nr:PAS domain-containing sensor histidine kinase [Ktedonobacteraceae bacterium]
MLDVSPDALVVTDQAGSIVMLNEQAAALFGYDQEELQGKLLESLMPERFRAAHIGHRERFFAAPRRRPMGLGLQLFGRGKDGSEFPVDISLRPLLLDDRPLTIAAIRDVTEQRRAERERLQQLEQIRLQAELINQAHDAIIVRDPISRILYWNRGAEELYGWTAQEASGRITHILLKTRFPLTLSVIDAQLEQEGQWEGKLLHTCKDGRIVTVESRQALFRDEAGKPSAILEINRDITERQRQEEQEHAAHVETAAQLEFLRKILDALPSSIYLVYGPDARLLLANRKANNLWGAEWQVNRPMLEFLATKGIRIFDPQGHPLPESHYATLRAVRGETVLQHQETIRRPDESSLPVLVNALPLGSQESWKMLQEQREGAEQQVSSPQAVALVVYQDVAALKETEYLKDEFIGIVAHELRTPLAALRGFADMLLVQTGRGHGPQLADWQKEALMEIDEATTRLSKLTDELLDVTRLQAGRMLLHRVPTDVVPLTRRMVAHLQQTTTRHSITVNTDHISLVAYIDPGRIEQVLINLIGNAIKYSPEGGPVVITIRPRVAESMVEISVQDKGIGIPERQHAQIFGRFMRADNASAWGIGGTGLGLYLSRELVEQHGGHLWFESAEGAGSTFFLTLPLLSTEQENE